MAMNFCITTLLIVYSISLQTGRAASTTAKKAGSGSGSGHLCNIAKMQVRLYMSVQISGANAVWPLGENKMVV